jgi:hypothetical protein
MLEQPVGHLLIADYQRIWLTRLPKQFVKRPPVLTGIPNENADWAAPTGLPANFLDELKKSVEICQILVLFLADLELLLLLWLLTYARKGLVHLQDFSSNL